MTDKNYRYYAFISYSRQDSKYAAWLQKKLEAYHLPSVLQKQYEDVPKKLKIFRDTTDIGVGGTVQEALNRELADSHKLIFLCSPASAKSKWCRGEVDYFLEMGHKTEDIFPLVVRGKIKEGDLEDCFPPKLHELNINAADITVDGKRNAFIRLLASLLGVKYDDLKNRERTRKIIKGFGYAASIILIIGFGLVVWNKNYRTTYKYYKNYVDRWGLPEGIYELNKEQVSHRQRHYRFEYRGSLLRKVVYANSLGTPMDSGPELNEGNMIQEMIYDENRNLTSILSKNRNGRILVEYQFNKKYDRMNLKGENTDFVSLSRSGALDFGNDSAKSSITSIVYERDKNGFIKKEFYKKYHNSNVPASDNEGIYGYEYVRDSKGLILEKWYLNQNNKHFVSRTGVASMIFAYDENKDMIEYFYADLEKNCSDNGIVYHASYDEWGNQTEWYTTDEKGTKKKNFYDGSSCQKNTYDVNGFLIDEKYYDENDNPLDEGYFGASYKYDAKGFLSERKLYDKNLNGMIGFPSLITWKNDIYGNNIEILLYDGDGNPAEYQKVHKYVAEYDPNGNLTKVSFFGLDGNLTLSDDGYAITVSEYDDNNLLCKQSIYGLDNKPVIDEKTGSSSAETTRDERGNIIEFRYYDISSNLFINNKEGAAIEKKEYDDFGNEVQISYYDENEQPMINLKKKYFRQTRTFNEVGQNTEVRCFGINDEPILGKNGWHICKVEYDDKSNQVGFRYYGIDERPIITNDGYALIKYFYDDLNNLIEEKYYDVNEKQVETKKGYAVKKYVRDIWGDESYSYFDLQGNEVLVENEE